MFKKILLVTLSLVGILWFFRIYDLFWLPDVTPLQHNDPATTAFIDHYKGHNKIEYHFVPYSKIAPSLKEAVVLAEDSTFFSHHGFDFESLRDALEKNWKKKRFARGGSTITQQLAKNLYLSPAKNPVRKIKEMIITVLLERHLSKQRIFELYLNVVEWGNGIYGAEAAARHYYHKPAAALNVSESAWLASILPSPRFFEKHPTHRAISRKKARLLSMMGRGAKAQSPKPEPEPEVEPEEEPVPPPDEEYY